ncbi:MAG TPA: carbohydrate ABC transporter permease [bacterium]|nr:carbohydrate ABC transporter permease [bacterium]
MTPAARRALLAVGVTLIAAWVLLPLALIAMASLTTRTQLYTWPRSFVPQPWSLETVRYFLRFPGVLPSTGRSLAVAAVTILLSVLIGAPAGYAISRFRFPGREGVLLGILATKMFPATILAVPLAVAFITWGLYDTVFGVALVHTALALPFTIAITTSVFSGVPGDLEEAAMTLGCSRLQAFRRIALPIALPGLAAATIFTFVLSWNEVFAATILTVRNRTLPALVMNAVGALGAGAPLDYRFAAGFFMVIPALVIIFAIRRYLLTLWGVTVR